MNVGPVHINVSSTCPDCGGSGNLILSHQTIVVCWRCNGTGSVGSVPIARTDRRRKRDLDRGSQ